MSRPDLTEDVGEDSADFAAAYARSSNNQVLLNILQARDGLPRHYVTVSGISDEPSSTYTGGLDLNPLGLGNAKGPFTGSGLTGGIEVSTHPAYSISPAPANRLRTAVYSPISTGLFIDFWQAGVPADVLLHLFVGEMEQGECVQERGPGIANPGGGKSPPELDKLGKLTISRRNSKGEFAPDVDCRFLSLGKVKGEALEGAIEEIVAGNSETMAAASKYLLGQDRKAATAPVTPLPVHKRPCSLSLAAKTDDERLELMKFSLANDGYGFKEPAEEDVTPPSTKAVAPASKKTPAGKKAATPPTPLGLLEKCAPSGELAFVLEKQSGKVFIVRLRTLDQVVTFLGEGLRSDAQQPGLPKVAPWNDPGGRRGASLFTIETDASSPGWRDDDFAAVLDYRGQQYRAGRPRVAPSRPDSRRQLSYDQTSTVLMILTQLYNYIPADDALRPPNRFTFN